MSTIENWHPCLSVPMGKRQEWNCLLHCCWLGMTLLSFLRPKLLSLYQKPPWPAHNRDYAAVGSMKCFWDCCSHAGGISQHMPVLFWAMASRIPHQRCGHNWPSSSWKPAKNLGKTSSFLGACVRFWMSQGLNLHPEDLLPFSVAMMLIQMVTWIHTELLCCNVKQKRSTGKVPVKITTKDN